MNRSCSIELCDRPYYCKALCKYHYNQQWWKAQGNRTTPKRPYRVQGCQVDGCSQPHSALGLCKQHRYKLARYGDPMAGVTYTPGPTLQNAGYLQRWNPYHPISPPSGFLLEHRRILYDSLGPGPHPCHWCGTTVRWDGDIRLDKLVVDHLDGDRVNNDPANLAPSCNGCNAGRQQ